MEIASDFTTPNHEILRCLGKIQSEISAIADRMHSMESRLDELTIQKDWYSTSDLAELMNVTRHTVQERWCNQARIECEKDSATGQWRIPAHEFERLKRGGKPLSNRSIPL